MSFSYHKARPLRKVFATLFIVLIINIVSRRSSSTRLELPVFLNPVSSSGMNSRWKKSRTRRVLQSLASFMDETVQGGGLPDFTWSTTNCVRPGHISLLPQLVSYIIDHPSEGLSRTKRASRSTWFSSLGVVRASRLGLHRPKDQPPAAEAGGGNSQRQVERISVLVGGFSNNTRPCQMSLAHPLHVLAAA